MASKLYKYSDIIYSGKSTIYHVVEFDGSNLAGGVYYYQYRLVNPNRLRKGC
jgi:hypothetical protein